MNDATAVNDARVLETQLFDYVTACAQANDDMLKYSCLIAWCAEQPGAIAEVGRVIAYALSTDEPAANTDPRREEFKSVLSSDAIRLLKQCAYLLRAHSGFHAQPPLPTFTRFGPPEWDYAYWLGMRIGHLLI